jgi:hypothetical protein
VCFVWLGSVTWPWLFLVIARFSSGLYLCIWSCEDGISLELLNFLLSVVRRADEGFVSARRLIRVYLLSFISLLCQFENQKTP